MGYKTKKATSRYVMFLVAFTLTIAQGVAVAGALKATPEHFEFGDLKEGEPAKVTVEIENTSDAPVNITNVRTS
jgi:hypothetical protein